MAGFKRLLSTKDVMELECTLDNQLHIIRHFDYIPEFYYQTILDKDFFEWCTVTRQYQKTKATPKKITELMQTLGSKFHNKPDAVLTPVTLFYDVKLKLISYMQEFCYNPQKQEGTDLEFTAKAEGEEESLLALIPDFMDGYCSLTSHDKMTTSEINSIYKGKRGSGTDAFEVNIIDRTQFIPTRDVVINIRKKDMFETPKLVTCFNGIKTPTFPNSNFQDEQELEISTKFWDRHAFINLI